VQEVEDDEDEDDDDDTNEDEGGDETGEGGVFPPGFAVCAIISVHMRYISFLCLQLQ
jgi:hypothetical protein